MEEYKKHDGCGEGEGDSPKRQKIVSEKKMEICNVFMSCQHTAAAYDCVRDVVGDRDAVVIASFPGFNKPGASGRPAVENAIEFRAIDTPVFSPSVASALVKMFGHPMFVGFRHVLNAKLK